MCNKRKTRDSEENSNIKSQKEMKHRLPTGRICYDDEEEEVLSCTITG
jgi:hypothetical protein